MSIRKNFIFNSILTGSNYIFPLIVLPYVTRTLGVSNFGLCNFVDGVVNYFVLFSMMGISTMGIREIAKVKHDKQKRSEVFFSLLVLNLATTVVFLFVFLILAFTVPLFRENLNLFLIGSAKLLFNFLLIEWFYRGLENFKYITIRSIFVKIIYVILVLLFVKNETDTEIYYILTVLLVFFNSVFNVLYARRILTFKAFSIRWRGFLKSYFVLGFYALLTSMYTSFNVVFLGFMTNNKEVGIYSISIKIFSIVIAFFTAFTSVMIPRMSMLVSSGKHDDFKRYFNLSIDLLLTIIFPLIVLCYLFTPEIIYIVAGNEYQAAILPMRIILPIVLVIGVEQVVVMLILLPLKQDKAILINSAFGAITGILINVILVPNFASIGSSVAWLSSEIVVLLSGLYFIFHKMKLSISLKLILKHSLVALLTFCVLYLLDSVFLFQLNVVMRILILFVSTGIIYLFAHKYYIQNTYILNFINKLINQKCIH